MDKNFLFKCIVIGVLTLLLMIPMMMIGGMISEREQFREQARRDIAQSWTNRQTVNGAILVIPYELSFTNSRNIFKDGIKDTVEYIETEKKTLYILPDTLKINGDIQTELRYRGIHKVPVYHAMLDIVGSFKLPALDKAELGGTPSKWGQPYLSFGVGDIRGIGNDIRLTVGGAEHMLLPGSDIKFVPAGVHAPISMTLNDAEQSLNFDLRMPLSGLADIQFVPLGRLTDVNITSPWPDPSFFGKFLPTHNVSDEGFNASWETSYFSTDMGAQLEQIIAGNIHQFGQNTFGVALYQGVDIYRQAERAVKYALLFIVLTFGAFFFYEVTRNLAIHPIQYGLVGAALAIFYVLLVSISEHTSFMMAYAVATTACVGLLTFYISFVLRSLGSGLVLGSILTLLYGAIYVMLGSESYSLLLGSIVLFAILAFVMIVTRNLNWYGVQAPKKEP